MINNNKVAYVMHSDMEKINLNVDYLMLDYDATLSGQPGQYFFVHINDDDIEALPIKIAANWYRNEEGKDFIENDFSIGVSIDRRVRFLGANIIKYYMAFKHWAEEYDQIILEPNMPEIIYEIAKIFKEFQPSFVFHLAAQSLVSKSYEEPIETFNTNSIGTLNVLESLKQIKKKCFVIFVIDFVHEFI